MILTGLFSFKVTNTRRGKEKQKKQFIDLVYQTEDPHQSFNLRKNQTHLGLTQPRLITTNTQKTNQNKRKQRELE